MGNFAISGSQSDVLGLMFPIRKQNEEEFLWGVSGNRFLKFQNFTLHLKNLYSYIWNNGFNSVSQEAIKSSFFLVLKKFIKCSTPGKNFRKHTWKIPILTQMQIPRYVRVCLEFIRTILYGRFHGIYLVKAIHSQNSVIHAGFCSFLLH